jgi:hypothetical protein
MAPEVRSHWEITWCKHSVYFSIGEAKGSVKLLEEIVSTVDRRWSVGFQCDHHPCMGFDVLS